MNKKFPVYHFLLLGLCLLATPLRAKEPELLLWHSQQAGHIIDEVIARFNQEGNHRIRVSQIEPGNIKADILLAANARGLPDLMLLPSDFIGLYQQMQLAPLPNEWFSPELMANTLKFVTLDKQRWGMPMIQGNHLMLFYNKELVTVPIQRWQDLAKSAAALQQKGIFPVSWPYDDMYYFTPFMHTFGGSPVTDGKITLDTPAMVEALNAYRSVAQQGWVDPLCDYDTALIRFTEGQSAYLINGDWAISDLYKSMGERLGITLLPDWLSQPMNSMSGAYVMGATRWAMEQEDRRDVIKALMRFIQRQDIQQMLYSSGALLPVNSEAFTAISKAQDHQTRLVLEQLTRSHPMPSGSAMAIAWQAMAKGFERFKEGSSASEAAHYMQQLADKQYQQVK